MRCMRGARYAGWGAACQSRRRSGAERLAQADEVGAAVEPGERQRRNARRGTAIAEREAGHRHRGERGTVVGEGDDAGDEAAGRGPDQPRIARGEAFGPLGLVAQHQQRQAEGGRFLLHPARIAEQQIAAAHAVDHRRMVERGRQADRVMAAEQGPHRAGDVGIGMEHDLDGEIAAFRQSDERRRQRAEPGSPILAPVTSDEQAHRALARDLPAKARQALELGEEGVDAAVAGDVDLAIAIFGAKIGGGGCGRREQHVGESVDFAAEFLLGPWRGGVEAAQTGLDMGEWQGVAARGAGPAERARRIALDDDEAGRVATPVAIERAGDVVDMVERIAATGATEGSGREAAKTVIGEVEPWVLAGQHQPHLDPPRVERCRDGRELDGFRPGPNDETDTIGAQLSPWLRPGQPAPSRARPQGRVKKAGQAIRRGSLHGPGERGVTSRRPSIDGILVAQISDLHIGFDRDNVHEVNVRRLNMVIDQLNAMRPKPSLLLVTGDLVENGDDHGAYQHMHALVGRWEGPLLWAIGNHDDRASFRAELPHVPTDASGFIQYEIDHGGLRWIVVDTLDEGRHGGMVCAQRAAWLAERLAERTGDPTVIVLHHPPVDTGIDWMSALACEEWVQRLEAAIGPAGQVVAIVAGHVHRPIAASFAGKPLSVCASTAPTLALDLVDIDPAHPDGRPLILGDSPAYALHYWNGERLLTHFDTAGPHHVMAHYDSNVQPMIRDFLKERGTG